MFKACYLWFLQFPAVDTPPSRLLKIIIIIIFSGGFPGLLFQCLVFLKIVLGPLLFSIHINDACSKIKHPYSPLFADDLRNCLQLLSDISSVQTWRTAKHMNLNAGMKLCLLPELLMC
jgi:hypothetical protein